MGPVAGDEAAVQADHRGGLDDQQHTAEACPVEPTRQHGQARPVRRRDPGMLDLTLQDQDLMVTGEDLRVTLVAGHQQ